MSEANSHAVEIRDLRMRRGTLEVLRDAAPGPLDELLRARSGRRLDLLAGYGAAFALLGAV